MAYILGTFLWVLSLLALAILSVWNRTNILGNGVQADSIALAAVFTVVYLFFIFLVWLFQRKVNPK
ncbi:hypothetical protein ACFSO0_17105 [Brevibacillus sp. GCM10020057]|uniref:hypothetical protein n=1 Tax=Brevibacillus sp. GCM10020057 TaxID=3317327 RepID=UPI0036366297